MSIHKSLVTSAVPSDCVVGAVALNCGPLGSVVEYAVAYPKRKDSIYTESLELRENPYHTEGNRKTDISGENVLLSTDFIYYGTKFTNW